MSGSSASPWISSVGMATFELSLKLLPMDRIPQLTVIDEQEPLLQALDSADLVYLLELPPTERLGRIVSLNRTPRYANRLNAFALVERLARLSAPSHGEGPAASAAH
jgi:hypothetical protein